MMSILQGPEEFLFQLAGQIAKDEKRYAYCVFRRRIYLFWAPKNTTELLNILSIEHVHYLVCSTFLPNSYIFMAKEEDTQTNISSYC